MHFKTIKPRYSEWNEVLTNVFFMLILCFIRFFVHKELENLSFGFIEFLQDHIGSYHRYGDVINAIATIFVQYFQYYGVFYIVISHHWYADKLSSFYNQLTMAISLYSVCVMRILNGEIRPWIKDDKIHGVYCACSYSFPSTEVSTATFGCMLV